MTSQPKPNHEQTSLRIRKKNIEQKNTDNSQNFKVTEGNRKLGINLNVLKGNRKLGMNLN